MDNLLSALPVTLEVKNDEELAGENCGEVLHGSLQWDDIQSIGRAMDVLREEGFAHITLNLSDSTLSWYHDAGDISPDNDFLVNGDILEALNGEEMEVSSEEIVVFDGYFRIQVSPRFLEPLVMRSVDINISALKTEAAGDSGAPSHFTYYEVGDSGALRKEIGSNC